MDLRSHIGNKIKEFRIKKGMTQEQLAEKLDTTKQTVSRYEKGDRQANQDILFQLSNVLKVSVDDFFPDNMERTPASSPYPYFPANVAAGLPENISGITKSDMEQINIPDSIMGKWAGNKDIFLTRINGDSMDKVMPSHSLIAVKTINLSELNNGDMVVFSDNYEYSVKYYYKQKDTLIFKPYSTNEAHHDQIYSVDDNITIHGKVVIYIVEQD